MTGSYLRFFFNSRKHCECAPGAISGFMSWQSCSVNSNIFGRIIEAMAPNIRNSCGALFEKIDFFKSQLIFFVDMF